MLPPDGLLTSEFLALQDNRRLGRSASLARQNATLTLWFDELNTAIGYVQLLPDVLVADTSPLLRVAE
jgi:hypothetical protein